MEGDAMMSAVAKYFDEIKVFAGSAVREPPSPPEARAGLDGFRRNEAEEHGQYRSRGQRASTHPAKGDHVRRSDKGATVRAGRQGCNRPLG